MRFAFSAVIIVASLFTCGFILTACDPAIRVEGLIQQGQDSEVLAGRVVSQNSSGVEGVRVILRARENPEAGFTAMSNADGYYTIGGIITTVRKGWNWSSGWELIVSKEGYKTRVISLDPQKHKAPDSKLIWHYRVNVFLQQTENDAQQ